MRRTAGVLVAVLGVSLSAWLLAQSPAPPAQTPRAVQSATLPDTPAGRMMAAWLAAFNSGDGERMRKFLAEHPDASFLAREPLEERFGLVQMVYHDSRGLDVESYEEFSPQEIRILARTRLTGMRMNMRLQVAAEPPHGITNRGVRVAPPAVEAAPKGKLSETEIVKELEAFLEKLVAADYFSGSVLVAKEGKPIFQKAYGTANQQTRAANQLDTKFNLGSMNKMFTAVAIAQLAEQGQLSFDDTVGKHLPDYPNKDVAAKVKIHHLLTHTSGIGDYFDNPEYEARRERIRTVGDYLALFASEPLDFEPGARFRYSNGGFIVLGAIIEKVSGMSYFDYVRENIYNKAGMKNTDCYETDQPVPNLAIGYTLQGPHGRFVPGQRRDNLKLHVVKGGPARGGFSTVEDLLAFSRALLGHKLLSPKSTDALLAGKIEMSGAKYAYGFMEEWVNGKRIVGHGGGFAGINGQLDIYPELGYTVAVLSNYDPMAATAVAHKLRDLLTRD